MVYLIRNRGKKMKTEDIVRDEAKILLGFDRQEKDINQGTGQITTFNQLGFNGITSKPDGWYLPNDASKPAINLETKSESENLSKQKWVDELFKNLDIISSKYSKHIGILWNGKDIRVFKNKKELFDVSNILENKQYYIRLCLQERIDNNHIYEITQKINNNLHFKFCRTE